VAFQSWANDLVNNDACIIQDIFVRNLKTNITAHARHTIVQNSRSKVFKKAGAIQANW
jgi:hypothetical protein